jgi:mannan endo-1,4-beta-mannosidase
MKKISLLLILTLFCRFAFPQISVSYTISPQADRKVISPYVYGCNYSQVTNFTTGENFTIARDGGNRTTAYNWENNASNAGSDYVFSSDNFMCSYLGIPDANSAIPGIAYTTVIDSANKHNAKSLMTLQLAGYVSRDKKGSLTTPAPNSRWCQVIPKKPSAFSLTPDTTDGKVYMDEFVNFLVNKYGLASAGGVKAYALDNEPDLWSNTHKYAHPDTPRCQELIDKTIAMSTAVKAVDNSAEIYGLVSYGFAGFLSFQDAPDWKNLKGSYSWFLDYYLDKTKAASTTAGKRLVDVLDLHWYPEAMGDNRICFSTANTVNDKKARLQAPRTLWDPDYTENSWIGQWFKSYLPLLPKVQSSINTYNPGTKLAFTEFDYGGAGEITGGIAMTDVLGIFGKYGVYASNYWAGSEISFIRLAFKMFRNYDGNNSTFGDMNIGAVMSDKENSSVYASVSQASDDVMHVIVLNKSMTQSISGSFDMNNTLNNYTTGSVYAFTSTSTSIQKLNDITLSGNKFTYTLPALSVYHFVLRKNGTITPVPVTGVTVSTSALAINFGSTFILSAAVAPSNATNRTVTWSSSNSAVAAISPNGLLTATVTAKSAGTATITVTTEDGLKTSVCNVTVTGGGACIFDTPLPSGLPGINKAFTYAYVLGSGGPNLSNLSRLVVNWDLANKSLNEFSAATNNGQPNYYVDLRTGATQNFASAQPSITLSGTGFPGLDGSYFVSAYNGDFVMVNKALNFSIYFSNSATPPSCGSVVIPVTGVLVSPVSASIAPANTTQLTATVSPTNATNKAVSWSSNNTAVATVSSTGLVTGIASGSATITVTTADGAKTATCAVTVGTGNIAVSAVVVSPATASVTAGSTTQLTATISPANATNKTVRWTSSDTTVATVSQTGLVTGLAGGTSIIAVTTQDGNKTSTCTVTVAVTCTGCNTCTFGTPTMASLPSINKSYSHVYVLGTGGPNLANVSTFTINWDLPNKGLYQFSTNTTNGVPNWYVDLRTGASQTFASAQPAITLSGTGFPGLDGAYNVTVFNSTDFVMVSKTGGFTIYFTNSTTAPVCVKSAQVKPSVTEIKNNGILVYPNPFNESTDLYISNPNEINSIVILDKLGRVIQILEKSSISTEMKIGEGLKSGIYILRIQTSAGNQVYMISKR